MKTIDLSTWPRQRHFALFREMDVPHFNLCANVDITELYPWVKEQGFSLNTVLVYIFTRAANAVPELRQRIQGEAVVEHEIVHPSFTVLAPGDLFSFCAVDYTPALRAFHVKAEALIRRVQADPTLTDEPGRDDYLFMTSIPWVAFTSIQHPIHLHPADSVPRIAWGKFFAQNERLLLPLSLQAHHALVDGLHAGRFYQGVQQLLAQPEQLLET